MTERPYTCTGLETIGSPGKGEELRLALVEMELAPGTKCQQGKDIDLPSTPLRLIRIDSLDTLLMV
jgi:hypothetical protein